MRPPDELDSAKVLYWAWSGEKPFGIMGNAGQAGNDDEIISVIEIYGFAICILNGTIYRFSCDREWKVQNDTDYESIQEAMDAEYPQYEEQPLNWNKFDDTDINELIDGSRIVNFYQEAGGRRIIQRIVSHLKTNHCDGMAVQLIGKDTWILSIQKKDIPIASEIARSNID